MGTDHSGDSGVLHGVCTREISIDVQSVGRGIFYAYLDRSHNPTVLCLADNGHFPEAALCCTHHSGMLTSAKTISHADLNQAHNHCFLCWYRWLRQLKGEFVTPKPQATSDYTMNRRS